jgi:hemerythrin superfamily protein
MGMAIAIKTSEDVVSFLKKQHEQIKDLFETVASEHGEARTRAFDTLRKMMAVHETAEEEIVHPAAQRELPNGAPIVSARLREEKKAKTVLAELESLYRDSIEFETKLASLKRDVIAHAESEEKEEFERLGERLDASRLARMRKAVELAEAVAPTHPHAGLESAAANFIVGPFASMVDRARDALSGRH